MARQIGVYHAHQDSSGPPAYTIDFKEAKRRAESGVAFFINHSRAIRMKLTANSIAQVIDENLKSSGATDTSISAHETLTNALSDIEPKNREVRRVRDKIRAWPFVGDTKAIRVGPAIEFA